MENRHGLGAGQWVSRLPTTASPIHELAYGKDGNSEPADLSLAELGSPDALSTPAVAAKTQPEVRKVIKTKSLKRSAPANELALSAPTPAPAPPAETVAPANPEPMQAQIAQPVLLAENDSHDRYASREQQSKQQQEFRGGDAIVITAGSLVVILLIVILILLLVR